MSDRNGNSGLAERLVEGLGEQRRALGLSQRQAGELIGRSHQAVFNVEQGRNRNLETIVRLRTALTMVERYGQAPEAELIECPAGAIWMRELEAAS